jgi:hypothetical protein
MGVKEEDIDKMLSTSLSERQHVSLAGNSICVPVLEAIFREFVKQKETKHLLWNKMRLVA